MRTYQYGNNPDGTKRLVEATRRDYNQISKPRRSSDDQAKQSNPVAMAVEHQIGDNLNLKSMEMQTGVEDMVPTGNLLKVKFNDNGSPTQTKDLFY